MTRRPHLELVRDPAPTLDELLERIEAASERLERLSAAHLDLAGRIARLESMFPRGTRRGS